MREWESMIPVVEDSRTASFARTSGSSRANSCLLTNRVGTSSSFAWACDDPFSCILMGDAVLSTDFVPLYKLQIKARWYSSFFPRIQSRVLSEAMG